MFLLDDAVKKEINRLKRQVAELQMKLAQMETTFQRDLGVGKNHILRVKNGEELADDYILKSQSYLDLSPEKAFEMYNEKDRDFILLDVSSRDFSPPKQLPESLHIPLEELEHNLHRLAGKAKSYFIISEDGKRSVLACKLLNRKGYYNINNISGGYMYWPEFRRLPFRQNINAA